MSIEYADQCKVLKASAQLLKLPHAAVATALVFLHRFKASPFSKSEGACEGNVRAFEIPELHKSDLLISRFNVQFLGARTS